jgi:CysZ protein
MLGIVLGSYLVLLFAMIITGFMTDSIVKVIHDKHYPHTAYSGHGTVAGMIWKLVKFGLLTLLLLIVTLPLLFIPLINLVWFWVLGFLFFRFSVVQDVGQVILPEALFKQLKPVTNWAATTPVAILFFFSVFPMVSFFAPMLAVIALSHYYFDKLSQQPGSSGVRPKINA